MKIPIPKNDEDRVEALKSFEILDSDPEKDFDEICALASDICQTSISYISLIDKERQWFKSTKGVEISECPREVSICSYAINFPDKITEIPDARLDDNFKKNPSVTGDLEMVFYASAPLVTENGYPIGTICVLDKKPNRLSKKQKSALKTLSKQIIKLLELRVKNNLLDKSYKALTNKNIAFEEFTKTSLNSITSPINTINVVLEIIKKMYSKNFDNKAEEYFKVINDSTKNMIKMIGNIKKYHSNLDLIIYDKEYFIINDLFNELKNELTLIENVNFPNVISKVYNNKLAIKTLLKSIINHTTENNFNDAFTVLFNASKNKSVFTIKTKAKLDEDFFSEINNLCNYLDYNLKLNEIKNLNIIELTC